MKGRKPKPLEVKRLEGNPGKRALPEPVVIGGRVAPPPPPGLSKDELDAWREIVPRLDQVGMLDSVDVFALEGLVGSVMVMRRAARKMRRAPLTVEGSQGQPVRNPVYDQFFRAQAEVRVWCERFGLDPSTRTRMGMQELQRRSLAEELAATLDR